MSRVETITLVFDELPPFARTMGLKLSLGAEYVGIRPAGSRDPFDMKDDAGTPFKAVRPTLNSPYCRELPPRQRKWDRRYVGLAREVASWSKDPSTKVGAVLVRPNNSVASTGYNGFPPGHDDHPALYADRAYKYEHVIHAEVNALNFYGSPTPGFTLYTSFPCCPDCVERAGKAGVARIVYPRLDVSGRDASWAAEWRERLEKAQEVAQRYGIEVEVLDE
ncbi:putative deoxycytidylate deaminase [Bordetella phage LK3]|uniref:Putative deoxycytidylate deaminase n=1 Tax=Bordetella phage LK3 TaxID=1926943 RepID=A0A2D0WB20_9CAUD|nr:putative deoxycytidylate deaminase [Bordetella phage LK3]